VEKMKICITGAGGYIGSKLAERLKDYELVLVDNFSAIQTIRCIYGKKVQEFDISDFYSDWSFLENVDILYHLAAVSGIKACENEQAYYSNVIGTDNLAQKAIAYRVKKIIFASSMAVYGNQNSITEETPVDILNEYARHKLEGEIILSRSLVPTVIFRKSNIYGRGFFTKNTVLDLFIKKALAKEDIIIDGQGLQCRNFVHLDDVVNVYIQAIDWEPRIYNIGGEDTISISDLADKVIKVAKENGVNINKFCSSVSCGVECKDLDFNYDKAKSKGYSPKRRVDEEIRERLSVNSNLS
jgi:UDP-glucose 4-epimerase